MKIVTIKPVDEPKSFADVKFTEADFKAAKRVGAIKVPFPTAIEAVKQSKGLYQIVTDKKVVELEIKGMKAPVEMTNEELALEASAHGKPLRKRISRAKLIEFITSLREASVEFITDDEDE